MPKIINNVLNRQVFCFLLTFLVLQMCPCLALSSNVVYNYDSRHRLLQAEYDNGVIFSYSYDALGNRLSRVSSGAIVNLYEDAEDGNITGWDVYDNDPVGATIVNIYDDQRASRVVEFTGGATSNGYRLRNEDGSYWNDTNFNVIEWSMRYDEAFVIYIAAQTKDGFRYIYYTASETDNLGSDTYVHHGLGSHIGDGTWQTIIRDLEYDLKEAQPDNEIEEVLGFLIRGSGRVDDIQTHLVIPNGHDSDGDGLTDNEEIGTYGTHPYFADSDSDGLEDGDEVAYWGSDWNSDPDGDTHINLLDPDADGDGIDDGIEVTQGTDPADSSSYPTSALYEDAEDGNITGWDVYDNDPVGATIVNIYDDQRASRVVEFSGSANSNGYRLRNDDGSYWNDSNFNVIEWSMRYDEAFVIYIAAQTKDGFRYIYYTASETDNLGTDTYVHHGLGSHIMDGTWQTIIRDLEYDLKEAQPDNELEAVLGFLIRGSGRVDDIQTHLVIPNGHDSDGDGLTDNQEFGTYGTHPYFADSDSDGLEDGDEVAYWGSDWNSDPDGDTLINLLDPDADGDGIDDGIEVTQGTDPADSSSYPTSALYEDAEDGNITGWDVYDNDPVGATIVNIYDDQRASRVVEFSGSVTSNGYRLRNEDGSYWNDTNFNVIEWSMRYDEAFVIYIAAQTKDGFRYIYYTASDIDNLGTDTYVHHGLGSHIGDGTWQTIIRDLECDLKEAQPDNELEAVLGFLIKGSGRVDDIITSQ